MLTKEELQQRLVELANQRDKAYLTLAAVDGATQEIERLIREWKDPETPAN